METELTTGTFQRGQIGHFHMGERRRHGEVISHQEARLQFVTFTLGGAVAYLILSAVVGTALLKPGPGDIQAVIQEATLKAHFIELRVRQHITTGHQIWADFRALPHDDGGLLRSGHIRRQAKRQLVGDARGPGHSVFGFGGGGHVRHNANFFGDHVGIELNTVVTSAEHHIKVFTNVIIC